MTKAQLLGTPTRLLKDSRGNTLMIFGFAMIPLFMATGMGVDYSRAARLKTKLNAAADAAALAAVTKPMMAKDDDTAKLAAENMFNAQAIGLSGLGGTPAVNVNVSRTGAANLTRVVTVTYSAVSNNVFGGILRKDTIQIGGAATSTATAAPDIDFYVMLDTSPSMAIPTTTAAIATMIAGTTSGAHPQGCAFACHQTDVSAGNSDTVVDGGTRVDYYQYARNRNLPLRIDKAKDAITDLTDVAATYATNNSVAYRMALATFNYQHTNIISSPTSLATVKTTAPTLSLVTYCRNGERVCGTSDDDQGSDFTSAFNGALSTMPATPGNGSRVGGDTPQAMLFVITDGMRDESSGGRQMGPIPTALCTTIKNRGIRIAILYTEYLWESANDGWSVSNIRTPYLDAPEKISPALTSCASPGLMYKVTTDEDISAALAALFKKAIETAHLTS